MPDPEVDPMPPRLHCRHCGDVIGAYEPMVVENHTGPRETSLAADPALFGTECPCFHTVCYLEVNDRD